MRFLLLSIFILFISSCTTVKKDYCETLDWYEQGVEDGRKGMRSTFYLQHAVACAKEPNKDQYKKGRADGIKFFCTKQGGFEHGLSGDIYTGLCEKSSSKSKFHKAKKIGKDIHTQREEVIEVEEKILDKQEEIDNSHIDQEEIKELYQEMDVLKKELELEKAYWKS